MERTDPIPPARVVHQHPLAYLLGLEGIALLRAFAGAYDREFTLARLAEIRALLDAADELGDGVDLDALSTPDAYAGWAASYDAAQNQLIELEQPVVREILDGLPVGVALDAACGTGRHSAYLAALGHDVVGVDESPEMLAVAREKVPAGTFHEGDLHDLPLADDSVDVAVCALAVSHVPDLAAVLAELVRVLRPGGHLVLSDSRGLAGDVGLPLLKAGPDARIGYVPVWARRTSDYLAAALPLGLEVRRCEEPMRPSPLVASDGTPRADAVPPPEHAAGGPSSIWSLHRFCPDAVNAAYRESPAAIVWHFRLAG
jgi:ubiquinone/menaquinone biosynthesis C-methylase UbiE